MHIYFSGIGGAGIGPLAQVAHQAGYTVSGSDQQDSQYISYLKKHGIPDIHIGQSYEDISKAYESRPIDWFVYSSALPQTHPELQFCRDQDIKTSKRDELLNLILQEKKLRLIAIAGTHGKTTTTALVVWLFKQLELPVSYLLPAKTAFAEMGASPDVAAARYLLRWIVRTQCESFTKRDAFEGTKGKFKRVEELEAALEVLENHGYVG